MSTIPLSVKRRIQNADSRVLVLEELVQRWVTVCDLSGVGDQPVSGDLRDNPFLKLLKDSREALEQQP